MPQPPPAGRWVLKNPEHLFALSALRAVYPDARVVFVHRDPIKVLLSVARLTEVLRAPFMRAVDRHRIGRDESLRWAEGTRQMILATDAEPFAEPICHVHHLDLVRDPKSTIAGVYHHFGLMPPVALAAAIDAYVGARQAGGYRHATYHFADHGLDEHEQRTIFQPYMDRFHIQPEPGGV
jgi:hypothetical protein